jgi:acyl-CoA synthetase (AMP-forming)/AMP-acid ligase II
MNVGQILSFTANKFPDRIAILFEDQRFTFREFNERANRFAHVLLKRGLKKGDKVASSSSIRTNWSRSILNSSKQAVFSHPSIFRFAPEEAKYIKSLRCPLLCL